MHGLSKSPNICRNSGQIWSTVWSLSLLGFEIRAQIRQDYYQYASPIRQNIGKDFKFPTSILGNNTTVLVYFVFAWDSNAAQIGNDLRDTVLNNLTVDSNAAQIDSDLRDTMLNNLTAHCRLKKFTDVSAVFLFLLTPFTWVKHIIRFALFGASGG